MRLIESVGYNTKECGTAREFIDAYDAGGPGCLILDLRLPGMNGLDLLEQLPTHGITIPVIVLTGYGDVPKAVRAMKIDVVDFLEKPFNHQMLVDAVHRAVERDSQTHREQAERGDIELRSTSLTPREREVMGMVVVG